MSEGKELLKQKYQYLLERGLKFKQGTNNFEVTCEFCESILKGEIKISKQGTGYGLSVSGEFHHDGQGALHLYCSECHRRIHEWGLIQRWLIKKGKTVNDLPDSVKIPPWPWLGR